MVGLLSAYGALFNYYFSVVARAGGGGSSSGEGEGITVVLGYLPMHFLGSLLRRFNNKHQDYSLAGQIIGWVVAVIYSLLLMYGLGFIGFVSGILAILGMGAGLHGWFGRIKQSKATKNALAQASQQDPSWNEAQITEYVKAVFVRFQQDWSAFNSESMRTYMTPSYQYHIALMMYALQLAKRQNKMDEVLIYKVEITDLHDDADNSQDSVTVGIEASAKDVLVDAQANAELFTDTATFTEFWRFKKVSNQWLLDGITPDTASVWEHKSELENFATSQGYYYSLDWGWLLLPSRGQLFKGGKFGKADINNHIIGMYKQCLVQLYTCNLNPKDINSSLLIAQTNVPKYYGNIVVKRKKLSNVLNRIGQLQKVSTEWVDFNNKYDVFATNAEQATSLELLNPTFMEKLEALPFEVNIEVVDNVVYLYTNQKIGQVNPANYQIMLSVLNDAFKEMKL